jgi:putative membrane protein
MMGGGLGMILFVGLIILLIVLAVRRVGGFASRSDSSTPRERAPLEILQERFARGDIDKEEYEERRKTLTG